MDPNGLPPRNSLEELLDTWLFRLRAEYLRRGRLDSLEDLLRELTAFYQDLLRELTAFYHVMCLTLVLFMILLVNGVIEIDPIVIYESMIRH